MKTHSSLSKIMNKTICEQKHYFATIMLDQSCGLRRTALPPQQRPKCELRELQLHLMGPAITHHETPRLLGATVQRI